MKQESLFNFENKEEKKYTSKIKAPIYEPNGRPVHLMELINTNKQKRLVSEINQSNVSEDEKRFLKFAAQRHNIFNYSKIAEYYSQASKEMQYLMEKSALVIIDFDKAIQYGYTKLSNEMIQQYLKDTGNEI